MTMAAEILNRKAAPLSRDYLQVTLCNKFVSMLHVLQQCFEISREYFIMAIFTGSLLSAKDKNY